MAHDNYGYVVMCKTRSCNGAFFKWYGETVILPFVKQSRDFYNLKNSDGTPMRAFVTCDGEALQIKNFLRTTMLELFAEAYIDYGKTPASCSGISQSSDLSPFFKVCKRRLAEVMKNNLWRDDLLNHYTMEAFTEMRGGTIPGERKKKMATALEKVVDCVKATLTHDRIKLGYKLCGQYPVDLIQAMDRCPNYRKMSKRGRDIIRASEDACVEQFKMHGQLTEEFMDELNIPSSVLRRDVPKDQRVLHQQRAVLMNLPPRIAAYNEYVDAQATAAEKRAHNAVERQRRQEELNAMTPEQRQEQEIISRQNRKRKRTDAEIAAMTDEERVQYDRDTAKKPRHRKRTQLEIDAMTEHERREYETAETRCAKDRERKLRNRGQA